MSTKCSIKHRPQAPGEPGFHLYYDAVEEMVADLDDDGKPAIAYYLHLTGVGAEMATLPDGGAEVTVRLSRRCAEELGLIPKRDESSNA